MLEDRSIGGEHIEVGGLDRLVAVAAGIASLVALQTADGAGGKWQVVDVAVGARDDGAWVGGRWIPGAIDGWQQVTLVADDDGPSGLAAAVVVPVDPTTLVGDDPYLTAGLPCTGFLPDWLVDGRCLRADLVGATVVLFGETDP